MLTRSSPPELKKVEDVGAEVPLSLSEFHGGNRWIQKRGQNVWEIGFKDELCWHISDPLTFHA
jgi:hypothetical protein